MSWGQSEGARISVIALMLLVLLNGVIVSTSLFASHNVFGYIFSNEKEVVDYVKGMAPLVCLSVVVDSIQGGLSGIARGRDWQHIGAYVNLAAFYLFRIPIAAALGFWLNFRGEGLWIGILSGATLQTIMLAVITCRTNWDKEGYLLFAVACQVAIGLEHCEMWNKLVHIGMFVNTILVINIYLALFKIYGVIHLRDIR